MPMRPVRILVDTRPSSGRNGVPRVDAAVVGVSLRADKHDPKASWTMSAPNPTTSIGPAAAAPHARVVGSYAAQPLTEADRPGFTRAVLALPGVTGLEISFESPTYASDSRWLWAGLPAGGRHVFTLIGATTGALAENPRFGLASPDD